MGAAEEDGQRSLRVAPIELHRHAQVLIGLRYQLLVERLLLLQAADGLLVLLHRPLRRLEVRLAVALEERVLLLELRELLLGGHRALSEAGARA